MSCFDYNSLKQHVGHKIVCVMYANGVNVSVECETCNEVILDYDEDQNYDPEDPSEATVEVTK